MDQDTPAVALFFFAHQDDEFGVFEQIVEEIQNGRHVCCAYLTDGSTAEASSERRNRESLAVLKQLGVSGQDVFFAGSILSIPDAGLPTTLDLAGGWVREWLSNYSMIETIYVPAWEGGHHDHDALHAIVARIGEEMGMLHLVRQFPLYNGLGCKGPLFRVFTPIAANGVIECKKIPWTNRIRFLKYCLSYPSQAKTWVGLFPFVLFHYVVKGVQILQPVSTERLTQRPHEGTLYYEHRRFFTWQKMEALLTKSALQVTSASAKESH